LELLQGAGNFSFPPSPLVRGTPMHDAHPCGPLLIRTWRRAFAYSCGCRVFGPPIGLLDPLPNHCAALPAPPRNPKMEKYPGLQGDFGDEFVYPFALIRNHLIFHQSWSIPTLSCSSAITISLIYVLSRLVSHDIPCLLSIIHCNSLRAFYPVCTVHLTLSDSPHAIFLLRFLFSYSIDKACSSFALTQSIYSIHLLF
jgi:hypothetical protein